MPLLPLIAIAICLTLASGALAAPAPTLLKVSPTTGVTITQTVGQPIALTFPYQVTTNRGSINWTCAAPTWLKCSAVKGKTSATVIITPISTMPVGVYQGSVVFSASTNTVTLPAKLTVTGAVTPPPPVACRLLDEAGGLLRDADGSVLTC